MHRNNDLSRRLGYLWAHTLDDGSVYMSGFLEGMAGDIRVKIVKNLFKEKESHAEFVILRKSENDVDEGAQAME